MRARTLALVIGALVVGAIPLGVVAWLVLRPPRPPARPVSRLERVGLEVLHEYPALEAHFASMSDEAGMIEGGRLSQRGLARLPDDEILDYARRREQLLSTSDGLCLALTGGGDAAALAAFEQLSDDDLRGWLRLSTHAQALELEGGPRPLSLERAQRDSTWAFDAVTRALPPDEAAAWERARRGTTPMDACVSERELVRGIALLDPAEGARAERAVLEVAARAQP